MPKLNTAASECRDIATSSDAMDRSDIAIKIENVSKRYRLGSIGGRTLQADLQSWWAKKRGKEDPNLPIGQTHRLSGESFMALQDINLEIRKGEAVGIIGINGAGKSTLLKIISQITAPTTGEVDLYGRVTSMLEIGTGFHGEMTGRENIYMNGAILGMTRAEIDAKIEEIIDFSEVREFIDTPVKRYSSGMFVKLAFAVAAHLDSEIMLMDEVLAVGDMAFQEKCLKKMRGVVRSEGRTVLYVSHNMNTIRQLCNRCIVLSEGRIIYDGEVDEAISMYMNHSLGDDEVNIDLLEKEHTTFNKLETVKMQHLLLKGKAEASYSSDEALNMRLTVSTAEPMDNVAFRLTLRNDADVGIGTAWSDKFSIVEAGVCEFDMSMPLEGLEKGNFYASIGLYRIDEIGQQFTLDHITRAFMIRVPGKPNWHTTAHGYMRLPEIKVEDCRIN